MTRAEGSSLLRLGVGALMAGGVSIGMADASGVCFEQCDGDCWIGTSCDTCYEGDPYDCFIHWDAGDQQCYDLFACQWSCPSCYVC